MTPHTTDDKARCPTEKLIMPGEWEPHRATWIAWPHQENDFPGKLAAVQWVYPEIVRVLSESEFVEILCQPGSEGEIRRMLVDNAVSEERFALHEIATDRSWLRDSLPSFVRSDSGRKIAVSWRFNGWAKYDNHEHDALLPDAVAALAGVPIEKASRIGGGEPLVLEGGAFDVDGQGTILVTEECLLSSTQERNPGLSREEYESLFACYLGATNTIWLGRGCAGDDTHGHVDDIARFSAPGEVLLACEEDPRDENYEPSQENLARLLRATDAHGNKLKIRRLPMPSPVVFNGQRLPASYANFYIANSAVLVPTFNDPRDREALLIIAEAFPGRTVVGIHSRDLVWGLGTLHCLTQQEPA